MKTRNLSRIHAKRKQLKKFIQLFCNNTFLFTKKTKMRFYMIFACVGFLTFDINCFSKEEDGLDYQLEELDTISEVTVEELTEEELNRILACIVTEEIEFEDKKYIMYSMGESPKIEEEKKSIAEAENTYSKDLTSYNLPNSNAVNSISNSRIYQVPGLDNNKNLTSRMVEETNELEGKNSEANLLLEQLKEENPEGLKFILERHMFTEEKLLDVMLESIANTDLTNLETAYDKIHEIVNQNNQEKLDAILEMYDLTEEEFEEVEAICFAEGREYSDSINNYEESYLETYYVANNIYNRTRSIKWISYVDYFMGEGMGRNLHAQISCPYQYSTYTNGSMDKYLEIDKTDLPGHQAVIDLFYTQEIKHDYLKFLANSYSPIPKGAKKLTDRGNWYYSSIEPDDLYVEEVVEKEEENLPEKKKMMKLENIAVE